jgi:hypothetical protein
MNSAAWHKESAIRLTGSDTCFFIPHSAVPHGRKATYGHIVVALRPMKAEVEQTCLTVGRNLVDYPSNVSTKTADLTITKILFNSVLSTTNAKFMGIDLKKAFGDIQHNPSHSP